MTNDVSRRNFVALAGVGLALGACDSAKPDAPAKGTGLDGFGPGFNHGQLAAATKPMNVPATAEFKSDYFSILYMRFGRKGNDRKFLAHHGYGRVGADFAATQALAEIELLEAQKTAPGAWKRKNDMASGKIRREENLDNFDFNYPNLMFIFVDHDETDIRFDDRPVKDSMPEITANLVRFSPILGQKDSSDIDYLKEGAENHSFFNAKLIPTKNSKLNKRKILLLENWYLNKDGTSISDNSKILYSMNIHLLIANDTNKWTPLVIDPDTGNGMGNSP